MELRKLQVTGGSTYVVSLPKKWVERSQLGRSDAVAIHEEADGSLLIVPNSQAKAPSRSAAVPVPDGASDAEVVRRLVGAYLAGADVINVTARQRLDPRIRQLVRDVTRDLVGVEILEETGSTMTLQDLVGVADMDLRKTVTRMHRIARIMYDDALAALQASDIDLARDVTDRDDEVDRLLWMVSKQMHALLDQPRLSARLNVHPAGALDFFLVARSIERMADHASKIAKNTVALGGRELPAEVHRGIQEQGARVRVLWDDAFSALKKPDFDAASEVADRGAAAAPWRAEFTGLLRGLEPTAVAPLALVADSVDRVRGYALDIAETAMNHTFRPA